MIRDQYNIIPVTMAGLVHVVVIASLIVAFDFSSKAHPVGPLAIEATLVTEAALERPAPPPEVVEPEPEPEPEPLPEPEPEPEPDTSAADRAAAEEAKRQADLQAEQERIRLQQEQDRERREQEERERRERAEAEVERRRQQAEQKRLEDLERQRQENERIRREAEAAERLRQQQAEIEAEERRAAQRAADDKGRWIYALQGRIMRNFIPPASMQPGVVCVVDVRQLPNGTVVNVRVGDCNGDQAVRRAIEAAVNKASPLPPPDNPRVFERDLRITFKPEQ